MEFRVMEHRRLCKSKLGVVKKLLMQAYRDELRLGTNHFPLTKKFHQRSMRGLSCSWCGTGRKILECTMFFSKTGGSLVHYQSEIIYSRRLAFTNKNF